MMMKRIVISLLIITTIAVFLPAENAKANSNRVLLVYENKDEMALISNLIKACEMTPVPVYITEYSSAMIENYEYVVLQDATPLEDVLQSDKRIVCLGDAFKSLPNVVIETISRKMHADLSVYNNTQSVIIEQGVKYISDCDGVMVGNISFEGKEYPMGVITDRILFAPYYSEDNLTAFAVAKIFNEYFNKQDRGKMYVMIDEVYPFDNIEMLEMIADKFYNNGIPFVVSLMPVYYNTDYPSFKKYAKALRYIQSKGGSLIMHEPIVTGNELVGDDLTVRMQIAYNSFEENDVHVFEETIFPFEVSLDMLSGVHPQNELFITLPIDTVIKFDMFKDEDALDKAVNEINHKWMSIGDYGRNFSDDEYIYEDSEIDENYVYIEKSESRFSFLVDTGNQVLTVIVIFSGVIIFILIIFGYRLYRNKFLRKRK